MSKVTSVTFYCTRKDFAYYLQASLKVPAIGAAKEVRLNQGRQIFLAVELTCLKTVQVLMGRK